MSTSDSRPPTIVIVHPRERRSKCTVECLRRRDDFAFYTFPNEVAHSLEGYVRLGLGGPLLSESDAQAGLLVLDGTWKLASKMEPFYDELPVRTLPPLQTAYPRTSKLHNDPTGGLATVEAVYAALRIMGRANESILDEYFWKNEFLRQNAWDR